MHVGTGRPAVSTAVASLVILVVILGAAAGVGWQQALTAGFASTVTSTVTSTATSSAASQTSSLQLVNVVIATTTNTSMSNLAEYVADQKGFFAAEGLNVKVAIASGDGAATALLGGSAQFLMTTMAITVTPDLRSTAKPVKILTYTVNQFVAAVVSRPEFMTISSLNGQKIGSEAPGSQFYLAVQAFVKKYNVSATPIPFDSTPARIAALQAGSIPAALISLNNAVQLVAQGYHILAYGSQFWPAVDAILSTTDTMIQQHPDTVLRFTRAIMRAVGYIASVPSGTQAILTKCCGFSPSAIAAFWPNAVSLYTNDFDSTAFQSAMDTVARATNQTSVPYTQVTDLSFYNQIVNGGI